MNQHEKTLSDQFQEFIGLVYPKLEPQHVVEIKRVFYAGAFSALQSVTEDGIDPDLIKDAAYKVLYAYFEMAQRDIAAMEGKKSS